MISLIIPSFNQKEFLPDAIESALNQTLKPREIIVIDDGSTDGSLEVARRYPVKVVSQVNKGLASARNTGIMNATGNYCMFLDADDILMDNAIEKLTKDIELTKADVVAPSFKEFGERNNVIILVPFTKESLKEANRIGYFSCIKRSVLLECGGYSPRMIWGFEDYHLWFDLTSRGKSFHVLTDILVLYRVKKLSMIDEANAHTRELHAQIVKDFPNF